MKIKFYLIAFLFSFSLNILYSQEDENVKGDWILTNTIGFATLEAEESFKINAAVYEGFIGKELVFSKLTSIVIGVEHLRIKSDFNDQNNQQFFISNNYLSIPINVQISIKNDQAISLCVGMGIFGSYLYKSKIENVLENAESIENGLGTNFGFQANFAAKFKVNERLKFFLGLKSKKDILANYKSSVQEFKIDNFYALQIGLGMNL